MKFLQKTQTWHSSYVKGLPLFCNQFGNETFLQSPVANLLAHTGTLSINIYVCVFDLIFRKYLTKIWVGYIIVSDSWIFKIC